MNKQTFSYISHYGTQFECSRCDFKAPIRISEAQGDEHQRKSDLAEMIGFHAVNIHPNLNGFQGYDCLKFI